jgi:hypothetical protein
MCGPGELSCRDALKANQILCYCLLLISIVYLEQKNDLNNNNNKKNWPQVMSFRLLATKAVPQPNLLGPN